MRQWASWGIQPKEASLSGVCRHRVVSLLKLYVPHASFASLTPNLDKQPEANQRSYKQKRCLLKRRFGVTHRITKNAGEIGLEAIRWGTRLQICHRCSDHTPHCSAGDTAKRGLPTALGVDSRPVPQGPWSLLFLEMDLTTAAAAATVPMDSEQSLLRHFTSFKSESGQVIWMAQSRSCVQGARHSENVCYQPFLTSILEVGLDSLGGRFFKYEGNLDAG